MPSFLATYDVQRTNPDPHSAFLAEARKLGWEAWILAPKNNTWYRLPNTTLIADFDDMDLAVASFKRIASNTAAQGYKVVVEKWIVVEYVRSTFLSDVKQPKI